jgi:hypothetical protein
MIYYSTYLWTRPPSPCSDQRERHYKSRVSLIYSEATPRTMALSTLPCSPSKVTLCPSRSHNALFMAEARSLNPSRRIRTRHQSPSQSFYSPALSPSSQNTRHFRHQQQLSKAGLLKPTHPVDTQPLPTRKLACIIPFGAIKKMSGTANTGAGQQPSFNTGASVSMNASVTSSTSQTTQSLSQSSTPPQTPVLKAMTKTSSVPSLNLDQPQSPTPQTPVLKGMTKTSLVPSLSLGQPSSSSSDTSLVTASPYTLNETTTFSAGTALWQSSSNNTSTTQSPSSIITASPYTTNESTTFATGTPLWQSTSANTSTAPQQTQTQTPAQLSTESSGSLITSSPYAQNEGMTFAPGTQMWQSAASQTSSQTPSQSHTSIITSSPYSQNESVTFSAGTAFWQPATTPMAAAAASNPNAPACHVSSTAPSSIRPMTAPCPASNIITASPYAQNEGVTFISGTSFWTSSANTSASATTQSSPPAETSLITSSPYSQNEGVTFPLGTQMWQSKQ